MAVKHEKLTTVVALVVIFSLAHLAGGLGGCGSGSSSRGTESYQGGSHVESGASTTSTIDSQYVGTWQGVYLYDIWFETDPATGEPAQKFGEVERLADYGMTFEFTIDADGSGSYFISTPDESGSKYGLSFAPGVSGTGYTVQQDGSLIGDVQYVVANDGVTEWIIYYEFTDIATGDGIAFECRRV